MKTITKTIMYLQMATLFLTTSFAGAAPADGGPVRVGGGVPQPVQLRKVNPVYPPIAQSARVQGVVILEATIDAQGHVVDVRVLRSLQLLDQAAIEDVRQWE